MGDNRKENIMGMDVYGLNPTIHEGTKKPDRPDDLHKQKDKVVKKYFDEQDAYERKNVGVYFRNNAWWWRPLANFMREHCDWFTQEQQARLHENSGFEFSEHEALTIADTLQKKVDDGTVKVREEVNRREMKVAEEWNKGIHAQQEELEKEVKKETGDAKIVPYDYPEHFKKKYDAIQKQTDRKAYYPFKERNVKRFIAFLRECGGFSVC
jgi:hypothetical protein